MLSPYNEVADGRPNFYSFVCLSVAIRAPFPLYSQRVYIFNESWGIVEGMSFGIDRV